MAGLGSLTVELSANIARFEQAMSRAQYVARDRSQAIVKEVQGMRASFDAVPGSILRIAAAAGGLYGIATIFQKAMAAADEFKMVTIGIAAGLTNIAKPGQGDWGEIFRRNAEYAKLMARELERVAAVSPAEPAEMMMAYNQLVQQGYAARLDEADALGVVVTRIKLATAGQASNKQINQEIRAVLQGQAKDESMIAMELKNRIGPGWADIVRKQMESGNLLKWWASLYPGITAASDAFQNTLEAQKTTLIGNLKYLSREGMGGAYDYIVVKAQELNTWITNNGVALTAGMGQAWTNLKPTVEAVVSALVSFAKFMGEAALKMTEIIARTTEWIKENKTLLINILELYAIAKVTNMITALSAAMVGAIMSIGKVVVGLSTLKVLVSGPWNPIIITVTIVGLAMALTGLRKLIQAKLEAAGVINPNEAERAVTSGPGDQVLSAAGSKRMSPQGRSAFIAQSLQSQIPATVKDLKPPEVQMPKHADKGGGGGKGGAEASADRMFAIIDNLNKEIAKLSQGSMAEIDAWAKKTIDDIEKVGRKGAETAEALALVTKATSLKKQKVEEDFQVFVGKESGDAYVELNAQARKWLNDWKGIKGSETAVNEIVARKKWETDVKQYTETLSLQKSYLDELAGAMPLLSQQEAIKKRILPIEAEIARYELERKIAAMQITDAQKDELRGLQALTAQAKKFNQEMEQDKGIKGWAHGRSKEAEGRNTIKDMMGGLESGFQNAFSSGLQGVLEGGNKKTLKDIGKTMFQGLVGGLHKGATTKLFDSAAKMFRPTNPAEGMGGGGGVAAAAGDLGNAAKGLTAAGEGLSLAGVGFNLNTAQFGLAAGGLLLSGIGIATNSQALVYAGVVLQVAGLAIQLYEALTATTTVVSMTMAAGALTGSAVALGVAATALMMAAVTETATSFIPFFHEGGPIYAHAGWPRLKSDEVPIIAQTGERVLSRRQNRDYEAGMAAGAGGGGGGAGAVVYSPTYHINAIDARGVDKVLEKHGRAMMKGINEKLKLRGRKL